MKLKATLVTLTAALGLTMSAQARLGWSLDECRNHWGPPTRVGYVTNAGQTCYNFRVSQKLFAQVYLLDGTVNSIAYCSRDGKFLLNSVRDLLQKNIPGTWTLYDDQRGKQTLATWNYLAGDTGEVMAYALLWNYPDQHGFYKLQVSTKFWDNYLTGRGGNHNQDVTDSSSLTNV
jgi:hypothetical protein